MGFHAFDVPIMESFDRRVLDRAVRSLGLTSAGFSNELRSPKPQASSAIGPGMIGLGQLMCDAVLDAGAAEDMEADEDAIRSGPFFGRSAKAMPLSVSAVWIL